jgi:DNA-directed RNA polymerase specialized sigma24 family protein
LSEALAALSPDEYEVLQLKDLELRPYREIVQILDISLSAAKMRVQRARLALMTAYGKLPDNS